MSAVVSLYPDPEHSPAAAEMVGRVARALEVEPRAGADGSWELRFELPYSQAHARVAEALASIDRRWPAKVTLDYVLAV
jgi:hypothetical protein